MAVAAGHEFDAFLKAAEIELMPVTVEHMEAARRAWRRYGGFALRRRCARPSVRCR